MYNDNVRNETNGRTVIMNKSATTKMDILTSKYFDYAKKYNEWKDNYTDDRRVYQNVYEALIEQLNIMGNIENSGIWVAYNEYFDKELSTLKRIIDKFEEMEN